MPHTSKNRYRLFRKKTKRGLYLVQDNESGKQSSLRTKDWTEAKSTTEVKEVQVLDLAFQTWVLSRAGLKLPATTRLTANQQLQRKAVTTGEPQIDRPAIAAFLNQLRYPLSFLDFGTFGTAVPLIDGVKPYQQVPFQFSLHVVRSAGAQPERHAFLAEGRSDPHPESLRQLKSVVSSAGSVVTYNAGFEQARLQECCDLLPAYRPWYREVQRRSVDLLLPFRGFRYYHPYQLGSASMKAVLPVLTGHSYAGLEIHEGGQASREYLRVHFGQVPEAGRRKVRRQLEAYCGQDTEGMIWIVDRLRELAS
jgi:hypothetical protein